MSRQSSRVRGEISLRQDVAGGVIGIGGGIGDSGDDAGVGGDMAQRVIDEGVRAALIGERGEPPHPVIAAACGIVSVSDVLGG